MVDKKNEENLSTGSVSFPCPKCGESTVLRSFHERELATKYVCSRCGFEGPN